MKNYDLEERTLCFAKDVRDFIKVLPRTVANLEDGRQLIRSSGSVGANYVEANEAVSKKDFKFKIQICRKEAKESRYWLRLILPPEPKLNQYCNRLIQEATELTKIFGAILQKC